MGLGPRHRILREATAAVHDRLDRGVLDAGYFSSLPQYGEYLQRLHRLHRLFDAALPPFAQPLAAHFQIDRRAQWLQEDLQSLKLGELPARGAAHFRTACARSAASFLGCLYVMLGASLGARFLLRQASQLAVPSSGGLAYLTQLARSTHWPQFLQQLEDATISCHDELVGGALATFHCFHDHLLEPHSA